MDIDTREKATETEVCMRDGAVQEPSLTIEMVSQFFCLPVNEAARELDVGPKKRCRERIQRWPNRKLKSLQKLIDDVKELGKDDTPEKAEKRKMVVQKFQQRKKLMQERPDVELDKETKVFREAVYREKSMIRARKREFSKALHA